MHADRGTKLLFAKINLQWIFKLRILLLWLPDLKLKQNLRKEKVITSTKGLYLMGLHQWGVIDLIIDRILNHLPRFSNKAFIDNLLNKS